MKKILFSLMFLAVVLTANAQQYGYHAAVAKGDSANVGLSWLFQTMPCDTCYFQASQVVFQPKNGKFNMPTSPVMHRELAAMLTNKMNATKAVLNQKPDDIKIVEVVGILPNSGNMDYKNYFAKESSGSQITAFVDSAGVRHAIRGGGVQTIAAGARATAYNDGLGNYVIDAIDGQFLSFNSTTKTLSLQRSPSVVLPFVSQGSIDSVKAKATADSALLANNYNYGKSQLDAEISRATAAEATKSASNHTHAYSTLTGLPTIPSQLDTTGKFATQGSSGAYAKKSSGNLARLAFIDDETFSSYNLYGTDGDVEIGPTTELVDGFNAVGLKASGANDDQGFIGFYNEDGTANAVLQYKKGGIIKSDISIAEQIAFNSKERIGLTVTNLADFYFLNSSMGEKIIGFNDLREVGNKKGIEYTGNISQMGADFTDATLTHKAYNDSRYYKKAASVPTSSSSAVGTVNDMQNDASYIYIKTANGWKRAALSTF